MLGKAALLYSSDKGGSRRVAACLRAAGNDVLRMSKPAAAVELVEAAAVDIVFLDHDHAPEALAILDAAADRVPVVALSRAPDSSVLLDLICDRGLDNLLARRGGKENGAPAFDSTEIVVTSEKILRQDLFGLRKYVSGFGIELSTIEVRSAEDRETVVACVQEYLRNLGAGKELAATLGTVADELVTNAVYNAPVDHDGTPRYASMSRREKIALRREEYVKVEYGSDGRTFGLAVSDRFGTLTREHLRGGLRRCLTKDDQIEQKDGGAGLGLYTVLSSCNQLIINVSPGAQTEVIALVGVDGRMREVRSSGHSLHLFIAPPVEEAVDDAVPVPTVLLSESMRVDLRGAASAADKSGKTRKPGRSSSPPARAPMERLPRGTLLLGSGRAQGIDTVVGALRGAIKLERAVETVMLFLAERYAGAVLWSVEESVLRPWCGAGLIAEWSQLATGVVELGSQGLLAAAGRRSKVCIGREPASPVDHAFSQLATGLRDTGLTLVPVQQGSKIRYVLHTFVPTGGELELPEATVLQRELSAAVTRLGPLSE